LLPTLGIWSRATHASSADATTDSDQYRESDTRGYASLQPTASLKEKEEFLASAYEKWRQARLAFKILLESSEDTFVDTIGAFQGTIVAFEQFEELKGQFRTDRSRYVEFTMRHVPQIMKVDVQSGRDDGVAGSIESRVEAELGVADNVDHATHDEVGPETVKNDAREYKGEISDQVNAEVDFTTGAEADVASKDITDVTSNDKIEVTTKDKIEVTTKDTAKETTKANAKDATEDAAKVTTKDTVKGSPKDKIQIAPPDKSKVETYIQES
jgi:hypothetical protein